MKGVLFLPKIALGPVRTLGDLQKAAATFHRIAYGLCIDDDTRLQVAELQRETAMQYVWKQLGYDPVTTKELPANTPIPVEVGNHALHLLVSNELTRAE